MDKNKYIELDYWCIYDNFEHILSMVEGDIKITDVALGLSWSNYWQKNNLDNKYGERTKIELTVGWQYPYASVDEFVNWFTEIYLVKEKEKIERIVVERNNPILPTGNLKAENIYSGKTILLTGFSKEDKYKRLSSILEQCNITLGKSVSKSLDYLICGPNNSISGKFAEIGKQAKAKALGIKIIPAEDFIDEITL